MSEERQFSHSRKCVSRNTKPQPKTTLRKGSVQAEGRDAMAEGKPDYEPTGQWEAYGEYDSNWERSAPVLVDPRGFVHTRFSPDPLCSSMAQSYADTYNMNKDKAADFRVCPYCDKGCSWCGG